MDNGRGERQDEYGFPSLLAELLGYSIEDGDRADAIRAAGPESGAAADGQHQPESALASLSIIAEPLSDPVMAPAAAHEPEILNLAENISLPDHLNFLDELLNAPDADGQAEPEAVIKTEASEEPHKEEASAAEAGLVEAASAVPAPDAEVAAPGAFAEPISAEDETELLLAQLSALAGDDLLFSAELNGLEIPAAFQPEAAIEETPALSSPRKLDWNIGEIPDLSAKTAGEPEASKPALIDAPALEVSEEFAHLLSDTAEFRVPDFEVPDYLKAAAAASDEISEEAPISAPLSAVDPLADTLEIPVPHHLFASDAPKAMEPAVQKTSADWDDDLLSQLQALVEGPSLDQSAADGSFLETSPEKSPEPEVEVEALPVVADGESDPLLDELLFKPEPIAAGDFAPADLVGLGAAGHSGITELDDLDLAMPDFSELIGQTEAAELLASLEAPLETPLETPDGGVPADLDSSDFVIEAVEQAVVPVQDTGVAEIAAIAGAVELDRALPAAEPAAEPVAEPAAEPAAEEDMLLAELLGTWGAAPEAISTETGPALETIAAADEAPLYDVDLAGAGLTAPDLSDDDFLASVLATAGGLEAAPVDTAGDPIAASPAVEDPLDLSAELPSFDELLNFGNAVADVAPAAAAPGPGLNAEVPGSDMLLEDLLSGLGSDVEPDATQPVRYVPKNKPAERLPDARQELERIVATTDAELASVDGGLFRERRSLALNANRHIAFQAGQRLFALPLESVLETDLVPRVTYVPGAGPAIRGVANVRGDLLSVVDLRDLLSIEQHDRVHERLLVVRQGRRAVAGFIIDSVLGIVPVQNEDRQPVPAIAGDPAAPMLDAVVEYRDRLMGVLDANRLVSAAGLEVSQVSHTN